MAGYVPFRGNYVPPPGGVDPEQNLAVQQLRAAMPEAIEDVSSFRDQVTHARLQGAHGGGLHASCATHPAWSSTSLPT